MIGPARASNPDSPITVTRQRVPWRYRQRHRSRLLHYAINVKKLDCWLQTWPVTVNYLSGLAENSFRWHKSGRHTKVLKCQNHPPPPLSFHHSNGFEYLLILWYRRGNNNNNNNNNNPIYKAPKASASEVLNPGFIYQSGYLFFWTLTVLTNKQSINKWIYIARLQ